MEKEVLLALLNQAQVIIQKSKKQNKDLEAKGEGFDIFQILQFSRYEEQLHTPMIRMLLDKDCNHGLKDAFLKAFIDKVIKKLNKNFEFDTSSSFVSHKDLFIGEVQNNDNGTSTGGKIDIFLHDGKKHAIIIENKFNRDGYSAQDQPQQLERYYNYGKDYESFILVYLTPDGHQASEYSTGTSRFEYYTLSYIPTGDGPSIISWLEECLKISSNQPRIHEVIKQYITYIKTKTGVMDENYQKEFIDLLTKSENFETTLRIIDHQDAIKQNIRKDFCNSLIKMAKESGLDLLPNYNSWDGYKNLIEWKDANGWLIFQGKKKTQVCFTLGRYKGDGILYGLTNISGYELEKGIKEEFKWKSQDKNRIPIVSTEKIKEEWKKDFPFGYSFLSDDRKENGTWRYWDISQTLIDMNNGKLLNFIKERFDILKELGVLDKL